MTKTKTPERIKAMLREMSHVSGMTRAEVTNTAIELLYEIVGDDTLYNCVSARLPPGEALRKLRQIRLGLVAVTGLIKHYEKMAKELHEVLSHEAQQ